MKKYLKNNLLFLILAMQPLLDILAYFQEGSGFSIAGYVRLALTVCIPLYTLIVIKKKSKFVLFMSIIGGFCLLHIANGFRVGYTGLFADVKYMLLVVHMPILLLSFMELFNKEEILRQIKQALIFITIVITVVFYVTYFFKSGNYTYSVYELGWTGWYSIPNAQSVIMVAILPFIICYLITKCKKWFPIPAIIIVYMYLENGTKTAYYSLILIFMGYFCFLIFAHFVRKEKKLPVYNLIMLLALSGAVVFAYNYSPRVTLDQIEEAAREEEQLELELEMGDEELNEGPEEWVKHINKELLDRFGAERVLEAYGDDIDSYTFADMRLKKRIYGKLVWEESDLLTKMVGFEYPLMMHKGENFDLENDPHAILYYYGYIGCGLYCCLLLYFLIRLLKQLFIAFKESLNLYNMSILMSWGLQLGLAAYTGYLLRRPNVAVYLMVVLLLLHCRTTELTRGSEK